MGGCSQTQVKLILRQTMINLAGMQQVRLLVTAWIRNSVLSLFLFASCFWYINHLSFHKMCNWFMKFEKGTNNQDKKIIFLQTCTYLNSAGKVHVILCDAHNWWATRNLHFTNINCKQPVLDITDLS